MSNKALIMGALTQMNEHPRMIARSLRAFQRSARVLSDNHPGLIDEFPNRWVAVADRAVIAHANTLKQVLKQVDAAGISRADVIVRFIDRAQSTLIL